MILVEWKLMCGVAGPLVIQNSSMVSLDVFAQLGFILSTTAELVNVTGELYSVVVTGMTSICAFILIAASDCS